MIKGLGNAEALSFCFIQGISGLVDRRSYCREQVSRTAYIGFRKKRNQISASTRTHHIQSIVSSSLLLKFFGASFAATGAPPASAMLAIASERRL